MFSEELKKNIVALSNTYHNVVVGVFGDPNIFGWAMVSAGNYIGNLLESSSQLGLEDFLPLSEQDRVFLNKYTYFVVDPDGEITPLEDRDAPIYWSRLVNDPHNIEQLQELGIGADQS